ncbi:hypothetical protein GCM10007853_08130 [Algimonas ampicilliniresistens]|uniref:Uncharacterized protein n=1 Tax=Algimonas ampicilliniresistens TaxID=1298735 RepID=A0ABQ5V606_9PROT|nr:hypothetical protein [Algimonas ampicilliniresistens]GLQ22939.1 hypothetical protein GCM10007853_08130 [Algimonas ampicilliniresistens]
MSGGNRKNRIGFLLRRKFPFHYPAYEYEGALPETVTPKLVKIAKIRETLFPKGLREESRTAKPQDDEAASQYTAEVRRLEELTDDEVWELSAAESVKLQEEYDSTLWFNRTIYKPDFEHWAQKGSWRIDEACLLSINRDPDRIKVTDLENERTKSSTAKTFFRRRDIAVRAVQNGQLTAVPVTSEFIAWSNRMNWSLPLEMQEAVESLGYVIADWHSLYRDLQDRYDCAVTQIRNEQKGEVNKLLEQIDQLRSEQSKAAQVDGDREVREANPLHHNTKAALLKIIYILTRKGDYQFERRTKVDPTAKNEDLSVANAITSDLLRLGVSINPRTVQTYLVEAEESVSDQLA